VGQDRVIKCKYLQEGKTLTDPSGEKEAEGGGAGTRTPLEVLWLRSQTCTRIKNKKNEGGGDSGEEKIRSSSSGSKGIRTC